MPRRTKARKSNDSDLEPARHLCYQVPRGDLHLVWAYLSTHSLDYAHFHASFVNYAIKVAQRAKAPTYSCEDEDEHALHSLLRQVPTPVDKYIEALDAFRKQMVAKNLLERFTTKRPAGPRGYIMKGTIKMPSGK